MPSTVTLSSLVLLLAAGASSLALPSVGLERKNCAFPNNTGSALHMYSCSASAGDSIQVKDVLITDLAGKPMYPINPRKPFILVLKSFNGGVQINDNKVDVKIYELKTGWADDSCKWDEMPTFGLLNGIDGCDFANNCPLTVGDLDLKIQLDLSAFAPIIDLLSNNTPVELHIKMHNANPGNHNEEIACVVAQLKIALS